MREIKFRAKMKDSKKSEWLFGYVSKIKKGNWFIDTIDEEYIEIDEKSISQYTGLKDKNGVQIYEGDIVSRHEGGIHFSEEAISEHVVKWGNFGWSPFEIGEGKQRSVYGELYDFIVIGNIYEGIKEESE